MQTTNCQSLQYAMFSAVSNLMFQAEAIFWGYNTRSKILGGHLKPIAPLKPSKTTYILRSFSSSTHFVVKAKILWNIQFFSKTFKKLLYKLVSLTPSMKASRGGIFLFTAPAVPKPRVIFFSNLLGYHFYQKILNDYKNTWWASCMKVRNWRYPCIEYEKASFFWYFSITFKLSTV